MAEGQGNITYGTTKGAGGGGIAVTGARNGLTVDTAGYIVLGQDIGAAGDPAQLLSSREIPLENFYINIRGNSALVVSDVPAVPLTGNTLLVSTTQGGKVPFQVDAPIGFGQDYIHVTSTDGTIPLFDVLQVQDDHIGLELFDTTTHQVVASIFGLTYIGAGPASGSGIVFNAAPLYSLIFGTNALTSFCDNANVDNFGGTNVHVSFQSLVTYGALTAGDTVVGFGFDSTSGSATGDVVAFRSNVGKILFSQAPDGFTDSRMGIYQLNPDATLHIGAANGILIPGPGNAQMKFDAQPLLAVPENGAFEFDGTHLYFTIGIIRHTIV